MLATEHGNYRGHGTVRSGLVGGVEPNKEGQQPLLGSADRAKSTVSLRICTAEKEFWGVGWKVPPVDLLPTLGAGDVSDYQEFLNCP